MYINWLTGFLGLLIYCTRHFILYFRARSSVTGQTNKLGKKWSKVCVCILFPVTWFLLRVRCGFSSLRPVNATMPRSLKKKRRAIYRRVRVSDISFSRFLSPRSMLFSLVDMKYSTCVWIGLEYLCHVFSALYLLHGSRTIHAAQCNLFQNTANSKKYPKTASYFPNAFTARTISCRRTGFVS